MSDAIGFVAEPEGRSGTLFFMAPGSADPWAGNSSRRDGSKYNHRGRTGAAPASPEPVAAHAVAPREAGSAQHCDSRGRFVAECCAACANHEEDGGQHCCSVRGSRVHHGPISIVKTMCFARSGAVVVHTSVALARSASHRRRRGRTRDVAKALGTEKLPSRLKRTLSSGSALMLQSGPNGFDRESMDTRHKHRRMGPRYLLCAGREGFACG